MTQDYRVIFEGQLKDGFYKDIVINRLAQIYQKSPETFAKWFENPPVVLKEKASLDEANQVKLFFEELGLLIKIENLQAKVDMLISENDQIVEQSFEELKRLLEENSKEVKVIKVNPAKMTTRAMAYVVDLLLISLINFLIIQLIFVPFEIVDVHKLQSALMILSDAQNSREAMVEASISLLSEMEPVMILMFLVMSLYFAFLEFKIQASFGKRLFNLRVYSLTTLNLSFRQTLMRIATLILGWWLCQMIGVITLPTIGTLIFFGTLLIGLSDEKKLNRTIYDRFSRTFVGYQEEK